MAMPNNNPAPDPLFRPARDLHDYGVWSRKVWAMAPADQARPENDNILVMGFGLAGETGETLEFFELGDPDPEQMQDLAKELGDIFYYWSCICWETGIDPSASWQSALGSAHALPCDIDLAATLMAAGSPSGTPGVRGLMLAARNGVVLEQLKKKVRDGTFDPDRFTASMGRQAQVWCGLITSLGLTASQVLGITINKVSDRIARGVLLGSGNHR